MNDDLENKLLPSTSTQISALEKKSEEMSPSRAVLEIAKEDTQKVFSSLKKRAAYCVNGAITLGRLPSNLMKYTVNPVIRSINKEDIAEITVETTKGFFGGFLPGNFQRRYFKEKANDYSVTNSSIEILTGIIITGYAIITPSIPDGLCASLIAIGGYSTLEGAYRLHLAAPEDKTPTAPAIVAIPYHTARLLAKPFVSYARSFSTRYNDKISRTKTKNILANDYTIPQLSSGEPNE